MWIEVFKSGLHKDSSGETNEFKDETLDKIAEMYNRKVKESSTFEAPLVKGHPKTDAPAYGWIQKLKRRGNTLLAKLKDISPNLINEVKKGMYKKVSIALYPDLMLRHVGLLGAMPPAVKGLKNVSFNSKEIFTEFEFKIEEHRTENKNNFSELEFLKSENKKLHSKIQELNQEIDKIIKDARSKEFREFANSLISKDNNLLITPVQADNLVEILEFAYQADSSMEFSEGISLVDKVKNFVSKFQTQFPLEEYSQAIDNNSDENEFYEKNQNISQERLRLHKKAKELQFLNPEMSYEEAVIKAEEDFFTAGLSV